MSFLIATILFLAHGAEHLKAVDLSLGPGLILHDYGGESYKEGLFAGGVLELSLVEKDQSLWLELGISGLVGGGIGMNSGMSSDVIRGGGIHFDAAYSLLRSRYVDVKVGGGATAKSLQRVREENSMYEYRQPQSLPRSTKWYLEFAARSSLALNLHLKNGIGGIELRPIKGELGPSFFDMTPNLAIYWPI